MSAPEQDETPTPIDSPLARRASTRRMQVVQFLIEYEKRLVARETIMSLALAGEATTLRQSLTAAETTEERDEAYRAIKAWNDRARVTLSGYADVRRRGR